VVLCFRIFFFQNMMNLWHILHEKTQHHIKIIFSRSKFDDLNTMKKINPPKTDTTNQNQDHTQEIWILKFCKSGNVWIPVADNMGSGVAAKHQPLILGVTWLGFRSAFLSRATCLNISSPLLLLGDQVLGPSTSWNHAFALGNTCFPQNLDPKLDH
jgi:hypothetical protein